MGTMIPGQAAPTPREPIVEPAPDLSSTPNTGPDKIPGVFNKWDLVRYSGRWSRQYIVVGPGDWPDGTKVIADCGCGGVIQVKTADLVHEWWAKHPDDAPGAAAAAG